MAIKATDMQIELAGAVVDVKKFMSQEPPRRIVKIEASVLLPALAISEKERLVLEAAGNACPVAKSLHPDIEQVITYQWQ
jgi:uncharacterized OsmC-like protein